MLDFQIRNAGPASRAAQIVTQAAQAVKPHWAALASGVDVNIASVPFNQIPDLQDCCLLDHQALNTSRSVRWREVSVACSWSGAGRPVIWVYFDERVCTPDSLQSRLLQEIAGVMWRRHPPLSVQATRLARETECRRCKSSCETFRWSFSAFTLSQPRLWADGNEWAFIHRLDDWVQHRLH